MSVVVVGGGLVGSALALALAQRGVAVTVLEKHGSVPDILRGELIMPAGVEVLEGLGVADGLREVCTETEGVRLHHPAFPNGVCQIDYANVLPPADADPSTWRPRGLCGWRKPLYESLRAAIEASPLVTVRAGFDVTDVRRTTGGHALRARDGSEVRCEMLVAADGYTSRLRALKGFLPRRAEQNTWVQGFVGRAPAYARRHVEVGVHPLGAAFVFPFPDGHVRSTVEVKSAYRRDLAAEDPLDLHLSILREALPEVREELHGLEVRSPLQIQPGRTIALSGIVEEGFALAGDAAGCLDPFTGYGMAMGLQDARALADVLAEGDYSARALRVYGRERQLRYGRREEATEALAYAFLDKAEGFADPLAARLASRWSDPFIMPLVAAQFAGYDPPVDPSVGLRLHCLGLL